MKKSTLFNIKLLEKAQEIMKQMKCIDAEIKMLQNIANTLVSEECELELLVKVKTKANAPQTINDQTHPGGINQMVFYDYREFVKAIKDLGDPEICGSRIPSEPPTKVAGYKFSFEARSCLIMCHHILKLKYQLRDSLVCELSKMGIQVE